MRLIKKAKLHYKLPKFHNDGTRISGKKIKKVKTSSYLTMADYLLIARQRVTGKMKGLCSKM